MNATCAATKRMLKRDGQLCPPRAPVGAPCAWQPTVDCYTSDADRDERRRLAGERRRAKASARAWMGIAVGLASMHGGRPR